MLSSTELNTLCDQLGVLPEGRALINTVRASDPSRRVESTPQSVACRYPSRKMKFVLQAESHHNELAAVYLWDHDDVTYEMYDQPPQIRINYPDKRGRTSQQNITLDYFLIQTDFIGWVECKLESWLEDHVEEGGRLYSKDETGKWRHYAGEEFAKQRGLGFRVRSSIETDEIPLRNLQFLSDFYPGSCPPVPAELRLTLLEQFASRPAIPLKELIYDRPAAETAAVYQLIVEEAIFVDLKKHLVSEPEFALAFRDEATAAAYWAMKATPPPAHVGPRSPLLMQVDEAVNWEGRIWKVVAVQQQEVVLADEARTFITVQRGAVEAAIRQGLMSAVADRATQHAAQIAAALQAASPSDLADALLRYRYVVGEIPVPKNQSAHHGLGPRPPTQKTVDEWARIYHGAQSTNGCGFAALITHRFHKGNRKPKLDAQVQSLLSDAVATWAKNRNDISKRSAWGQLQNDCLAAGLVPPSEKSFLNATKKQDAHAVKAAQEGARAAYNLEDFLVIDRTTPRHGERAFHIGHIDHTQLDVQLRYTSTSDHSRKPWLSVMLDATCRYVFAWSLSYDPPSYVSCMQVLQKCVERHHRVPDIIVSDSGAEFESVYYETLLASLCVTKKTRGKGKPRFGTLIERWFGVTNQQFIHSLQGNNKPLQKPRIMSASHDPRDRAIWTLAEFEQRLEEYIRTVYHACEHPALGVMPEVAFTVSNERAGLRAARYVAYDENFRMLSLPSTRRGTAQVQKGRGVKINYLYYSAPALREPKWQRQQVPVRFDPMDVSIAYAFLDSRWVELRSECAADFRRRSVREIELLTRELRARYGDSYARRSITARVIANFMNSVKDAEAILEQRRRDEEFWKSRDAGGQGDNSVPQASPSTGKPGIPKKPPMPPQRDPAAAKGKWGNREYVECGALQ